MMDTFNNMIDEAELVGAGFKGARASHDATIRKVNKK